MDADRDIDTERDTYSIISADLCLPPLGKTHRGIDRDRYIQTLTRRMRWTQTEILALRWTRTPS